MVSENMIRNRHSLSASYVGENGPELPLAVAYLLEVPSTPGPIVPDAPETAFITHRCSRGACPKPASLTHDQTAAASVEPDETTFPGRMAWHIATPVQSWSPRCWPGRR
jgi:hypothetical protein